MAVQGFSKALVAGAASQTLPATVTWQLTWSTQPPSGPRTGVTLTDLVPAGYTVNRSWTVVNSQVNNGPVTGQTGTGDINFVFDIPQQIAGTNSIIVNVTDEITAGPVGLYTNSADYNAQGEPEQPTAAHPATASITITGAVGDPTLELECPPFAIHSQQATFQGIGHAVPVGDIVRFQWTEAANPDWLNPATWSSNRVGTGADPQPLTDHTVPHGNLIPSTNYLYRLAHFDAAGTTLIGVSPDCGFTTRAAGDEHYIACNTGPAVQAQYSRTIVRAAILFPQFDEPAPSATDEVLIEIRELPGGTFAPANAYQSGVLIPNPVQNINQFGVGVFIGDLEHSKQYETRWTLRGGPAPIQVIQTLVCPGPFTTRDRPNPTCGVVSNVTETTADIRVNGLGQDRENPGGPSNLAVFTGGDEVTIEIATALAGPYVAAGSTVLPNDQFSQYAAATVPLTGLTPNTTYFYRIRITEDVESGGEYWLSDGCGVAFTTEGPDVIVLPTLTKVTDPGPFEVGDEIRSLVQVSNSTEQQINTRLIDRVQISPPGTTRRWTSEQTGGVVGNQPSGTGDIDDDINLAPGSQVTYTIYDRIASPGVYENFAAVDGGGFPEDEVTGGVRIIPGAVPGELDVACAPACAPNAPIGLPVVAECAMGVCQTGGGPGGGEPAAEVSVTNTPNVTPTNGVALAGIDCAGAPVNVTGMGTVRTVPHPTAVQQVRLCEVAPEAAEIDQYESPSVPACFDNAGVITTWWTSETVRFDNASQTELSRSRKWYNPLTNVTQLGLPPGTAVPCTAPQIADTFATTVQDVAPGGNFTIAPGTNLVSWTVRNRNATTATVQVNSGQVLTLDPGEELSSGDVESDGDVLQDTVAIVAGNGSVRLTILRRTS